MFGSGFTLGFTLSDVTTQVTGFLGNPVIVGLMAASLALMVIPSIIHVVKSALDRNWQWDRDDAGNVYKHHM